MVRGLDLFGAQAVGVTPCAPTPGPFDYLAPPGVELRPGDYVRIPLGGREAMGVVWGAAEGQVAADRMKSVVSKLDLPPMSAKMRAFLEKAAEYTMTPLGEMARLATRAPGLEEPAPRKRVLRAGTMRLERETPARLAALETFEALAADAQDFEVSPAALAKAAEVSAAVVNGLAKAGALIEKTSLRDAPYPRLDPQAPSKELSQAQAEAAEALRAAVAQKRFEPILLHGVTGSGKTEAYLEAIAQALREGRQALVLLPEIALTDAFISRIEARFGARPAEWHSAARGVERRRCWRAAASGQAQVVVGARSALYLPFADLGAVIVDEEHDGSYKQGEGAIYSARDMAVLRASIEGAAVVLASATPSLETWVNAEIGRYKKVSLPHRFGPARKPKITPIDLRIDRPERDHWIAPGLAQAVDETLARGEQALLFLNRRGYAPLTLCRSCGHRFECPHCDARLVSHRFSRKLICHVCGYERGAPEECPKCGEDDLTACGPGVERLAEEAAERFAAARLSILSSDAAPSAQALRDELARIASGEAQLIIGTQIVAKGHNFPNLTLVGVIDADLGLEGGDFRAAERTFQLISQVAGRAGRAEKPGRALIQTANPDQPVMRRLIAGDAEGFLEAEAEERARHGAPPFGRYLAVIFSGPDQDKVWACARAYAQSAKPLREAGAQVFGPAPAPIERVRGKFRARMLVKAPRNIALQSSAHAWVNEARPRLKGLSGVRVVFDVDPQNFM